MNAVKENRKYNTDDSNHDVCNWKEIVLAAEWVSSWNDKSLCAVKTADIVIIKYVEKVGSWL